jgi:hypothetical protein
MWHKSSSSFAELMYFSTGLITFDIGWEIAYLCCVIFSGVFVLDQ